MTGTVPVRRHRRHQMIRELPARFHEGTRPIHRRITYAEIQNLPAGVKSNLTAPAPAAASFLQSEK
jgi:glycine betaine/choline ABC-type transport system substrate-binding protein